MQYYLLYSEKHNDGCYLKYFLLVIVIIISSITDICSQWYSLGFQGYGNKSAPTIVSHNNALLLTDNNWTNFGLLRSGSNSWEIVNGTKSRFTSILKLDDDLIFFANAE